MDVWRILRPIWGGGLFWIIVQLNHTLFQQNLITVGMAGMAELCGLVFAIICFVRGVRAVLDFVVARRSFAAILAICSLILGIALLGYGFDSGAALLYAT